MLANVEEKVLDGVEKGIREREAQAHPTDTTLICAVIHARMESGAGLNLENACPYIRTRSDSEACECMPPSSCIGRENYRKCPVYEGRIAQEVLSGTVTA